MSAPPRTPRGGGLPRGRAKASTALKGHGREMNGARGARSRGGATASTNAKAENLLQGLRSGSLNQRPDASRRGSGKKRTSVFELRIHSVMPVAQSLFLQGAFRLVGCS